jgi:hypothetical protein
MNRLTPVLLLLLIAIVASLPGCSKTKKSSDVSNSESPTQTDQVGVSGDQGSDETLTENEKRIQALTRSEELLQSFADQFSQLSKSMVDRNIEDNSIVDLQLFFMPKLNHRGLGAFDFEEAIADAGHGDLAIHLEWPIDSESKEVQSSDVWASLLSQIRFEDCQIGTLSAIFEDGNLVTETKIEGRLKMPDTRVVGVKAYQTLTWSEVASGGWRISNWDQTKFSLIAAPQPLFTDVTAEVIPDEATRAKIQNSSHVDLILRNSKIAGPNLKDSQYKYKHFNDWESAYQYPGVSVVDLDQDGFDDLFVTDRWQSGQLLRNTGKGQFEDVTEQVGLEVKQLANSALFADFDNDGDSDVFVGGTLAPSQYFENVDGKFQRDESLDDELEFVKFVVSGSVVDINGDGLLDLYLNTYGLGTGDTTEWIEDSVRLADRVKMRLKVERSHFFLDRAGAPNIVLLNKNGTFERAEIDDTLAQWRNSYQSVWADFDDDGDQDVYLCNDFSPDCFLRNDTQRGSTDLKFVDVSTELVPGGTMGFGMGASWGDFNNDGQQDLYVSNMYSKAGNRIVAQFDGVDERVKVSARGNFLYENNDGKFKQVAGTDAGDQKISQVGWSFGGQFADFDNDGELDLYVPSGFYTPPNEVRKEGDW